jgi:hypothetical protein
MFDGHQEGIPAFIVNLVTSAVVLDLDDNGPELAYLGVHEKRPE